MSVRRTVAQSSAGLLLLAAFAAGPTAVYAEPGGPSDVEGGSECSQDETGQYQTTLSVAPSQVAPGNTVGLTMHCFPGPERETARVTVTGPKGFFKEADSISAAPGGTETLTFKVPEGAEAGDYSFVVNAGSFNNNATFEVVEGGEDPPTTEPEPEPEPDDPSDEPDPGETTPPSEGDDEDQGSGDDEEQGGDAQNPDDEEPVGDGSDNSDNTGTGDSGSDDDQQQDTGDKGRPDDTGDSDEGQQGGDTTASDSPTKHVPGDKEGGETSASSANGNAASRGDAPAQPPAAPGSATNDFPAAQQEATADQKQSAALAVLMTQLFAGGVSTGSVGTTPDQARTVIDPSADASEIEVPAGSDTGGSSDDGSGSESSDGDALAATGSNMPVPAGIAAAAILLGAGLKIHQLRRGL